MDASSKSDHTLAGIGYQIDTSRSQRRASSQPSDDSDIEKLIQEVGDITKIQAGRLIELIKATRSLAGTHLLYNWKFSFRPEPITWKEFEGFVAHWSADRRPEVIAEWVVQQAATTSIDSHRIEQDLFETLLNAKQQALSEATSASSADEHAKHTGRASELLTMMTQFLSLPEMLTDERFGKLYGNSQYWIAFQMNDGDKALRQQEKAALESLILEAPTGAAPGILKELAPWDSWAFTPDEQTVVALKKQLRAELAKLVLPKTEKAVVEALRRSKISSLALKEGMPSFAYVLMNPESLPWPEPIRQAMLAIAKGAKSDPFRYEQVNDLLRFFFEIIEQRTHGFNIDAVKTILKDPEFTTALWTGATCRAIQYRMLNLYLGYRSALIKAGVSEDHLPLTAELQAAAARAQAQTDNAPESQATTNTEATEQDDQPPEG
jgi:hypothetical protein